jgi:hypothetical protein
MKRFGRSHFNQETDRQHGNHGVQSRHFARKCAISGINCDLREQGKAQTNETDPYQIEVAAASFASVHPQDPAWCLEIFRPDGMSLDD